MKLSIVGIGTKLLLLLQQALRYAWLICLVFLVAIYGFMVWRIGVLASIPPDPNQVSAQLKTAQVPHVDKNALKAIQDLQDNSVSVQTLFSQARDNPFQE
jgi:hypothetical protein